MNRRIRKTLAVLAVILLAGSAVAATVGVIPISQNDDGVVLNQPGGPQVTLTGNTEIKNTSGGVDSSTIQWNTTDGSARFEATGDANATIPVRSLDGQWVNLTAIDTTGSDLTVRTGEVAPTTISGQVNELSYQSASGVGIDDGAVDFVYSADGDGTITLNSLPPDATFEAATLSGTSLGTVSTDSTGSGTISVKSATDGRVVLFNNEAPTVSEVRPEDGEKATQSEIEFSAQINDTDFESGDSAEATLFVDGEKIGTKSVSSNQTVSITHEITTGGGHNFYWRVNDSFSSTVTSSTRTVNIPSELRIFNESAPDTLVDNVTVNIQFYGGEDGDAFTIQRTTSDGIVDMTGLPADQEFIVVANADGFHNRRIYVESLYEQANVFLLPTSSQAVYNVFKIDDKSGAYAPGETRLIIQRGLNRSGNFSWYTVTGDFFGSTNEHKTYLRYNVRYRLIVENDEGQRRMMGPYFATDENNPKVITVSSIVVSPPEGQAYYGTSYIEDETEDDGQKTLRFTYTDPDEKTDSLDLVIHERGNESNVLADVSTDDVGSSWTYSTVLDENESAKSWVVDWQGQRDGEEIGAAVPVGNRGGLPLPMNQEWLTRFGLIALVVVASLSSERMATIGAMGTVAFAGILMITGIWEIPVVLWFAALIIAVGGHALTKAQRGGVVG